MSRISGHIQQVYVDIISLVVLCPDSIRVFVCLLDNSCRVSKLAFHKNKFVAFVSLFVVFTEYSINVNSGLMMEFNNNIYNHIS